ncbi:MAG: hypothetical protein U1E62_09085 [Alsobacter sp.]
MKRFVAPVAMILWAVAVPVAAQQSAPAQDVTVTNAIRPADPLPCRLDADKISKVGANLSVADVTKLTGCTAQKVSSFEMLGQTTEIFEFRDSVNRLQLTLRNNKLVSQTFRKL